MTDIKSLRPNPSELKVHYNILNIRSLQHKVNVLRLNICSPVNISFGITNKAVEQKQKLILNSCSYLFSGQIYFWSSQEQSVQNAKVRRIYVESPCTPIRFPMWLNLMNIKQKYVTLLPPVMAPQRRSLLKQTANMCSVVRYRCVYVYQSYQHNTTQHKPFSFCAANQLLAWYPPLQDQSIRLRTCICLCLLNRMEQIVNAKCLTTMNEIIVH